MTNIIAAVVSALLTVESSGGRDLHDGDGGRAVGPYQMWTVSVDEANRIEGIYSRKFGRKARVWSYSDRRCPVASHEMCELIMIWYYRRGVTDPVKLACRWRNPYSPCPVWYKRKIGRAMKGKRK